MLRSVMQTVHNQEANSSSLTDPCVDLRGRRLIGRGFLSILCCVAAIMVAQPSRADLFDQVAIQIKINATVQAQGVWNKLALPAGYLFQPASVEIAYGKLTQLRSRQDAVTTYVLPGPFLHLVKQAVMVNAAGYALRLPHSRFFAATTYGFNAPGVFPILGKLRDELNGYQPDDPNSLGGPVSSSKVGTNSVSAAIAVPAVPPCSYTITFENIGLGTATHITVLDDIDMTLQQANTFSLAEVTWGYTRLYPTVCKKPGGSVVTIPPGTLAPVPGNGQTYLYSFPGGNVMTVQRKDGGTKSRFTWSFVGWPLATGQNGSVSFLIDPFGAPTALNVSNPGAWIQFNLNPWILTNPWLRPGTVF